jgi:hypothetical protein
MKTMTLEANGNPEQLTPKKIPARARKLAAEAGSTDTLTRSSVFW